MTIADAGIERDVVVTADVTATIGSVAERLAGGRGTQTGVPLTLRVWLPDRPQARLLNPSASVHESSLRSGCRVQVVPATDRRRGDDVEDAPAAVVQVLSGPEAGNEYTLSQGVNLIGRDAMAQVYLADDDQVSRRHASVTVGETIEVVDLNSANGVAVDGRLIARSFVGPDAVVQVGGSTLRILPLSTSPLAVAPGAVGADHTEFSRSPRVDPAHRGKDFTLPEIPVPGERPRLPVIAILAPVILGGVLFLVTKQPYTLIFIALSPVIMIGTWIDQRVQDRRRKRDERQRFEESLEDTGARLATARAHEVEARVAESPAPAVVTAAMRGRSELLWTRKPEHTTFLEVRFGAGEQPSRSTVVMPSKNSGSVDDWNRAEALADEYATVGPVPVVETFERAGAIGVAGTGLVADDVARSLVVQLVGLHSPADLVVTAFAGGTTTDQWAWLKWLPHVDSPYSPLRSAGLVRDFAGASTLLAELEGLVATRRAAGVGRGEHVRSRIDESRALDEEHGESVDRLPATPAVVVLVTAEAPADRARLVALAEEGPDYGVHLLWLASTLSALPVVCRTYVSLDRASGTATVGFVRSGQSVVLDELDRVDSIEAATVARSIAPVQDSGARVLDETDLPHSVAFVDLYEGDVAGDAGAVVSRWSKNDSLTADWVPGAGRESGGIRAVVGQGPSEPLALDLRAHGPHALVGGTTGSGKSEFLQTWIMGMAAEYSPDRVTFLLVDYKGGAAFAECVGLPHTVGLVTDLNQHLVRRALTSLRAELRYREHLLNERGAKDLVTLEQRGDQAAPPALVIVIDEFAALASEIPEFIDGVIDVAQRGRSLGLHLVMATQRPSGVIKDSLRANTNLRIALRVADPVDSEDVLGVSDAAFFDPGTPGRAAAKMGPGRVLDFQTAYLGGRSDDVVHEPDVEVQEFPFGPGTVWPSAPRAPRDTSRAKDIERLAATIARAADERALAVPRKPWLDQLPDTIDLGALPASTGSTLVVGTVDVPESQQQTPFGLDLDLIGNLAVLGAGGAGKSATLRAVAVAASAVADRFPVQITGLDFGGGGLSMLEALPTVGTVISGPDDERITRLLGDLEVTISDRSARFAAARAANISEYRAVTGFAEPRILVLIDGMGAFRNEYEFRPGSQQVFDQVVAIAATGRALGVHLVMSADRMGAFPSNLQAAIGERIVLRLASELEYIAADVAADVLEDAVAGRGLVDDHEVQLAVPAGTADLVVQDAAVSSLATALVARGVAVAPPIRRLPAVVDRASLPASVGGRPTIGLADDTLAPIGIPGDGLFVVTGPFGSGRSTTMQTLIRSVRQTWPERPAHLIVGRRSVLRDATAWTSASTDGSSAETLASELATRLESATPFDDAEPIIVIENVGDFEGLPAEGQVARLIKAARRAGIFVLAEADTVTAPSAWQLFGELKTARAGIALQPEETDGLTLFRTAFPRVTRSDFPVGRGIMVESGRITRVQVAHTLEAKVTH
ncbi:FHA domain-containing protein [Curtobacterium sp. YC1]|uniref:FtsK/SpoIIIE domain-containing protein n=1 Tax=Curtobacterium sp. YC1 TaxID=2795488 RepID=UPI0018E4E93D|nr:FtsK/SpoIIIE domain-containing protein [Curtobacterium sp. YC1]QQD77180.1 FHA domain-containing protein [Curtobacterium sp. YC1]